MCSLRFGEKGQCAAAVQFHTAMSEVIFQLGMPAALAPEGFLSACQKLLWLMCATLMQMLFVSIRGGLDSWTVRNWTSAHLFSDILLLLSDGSLHLGFLWNDDAGAMTM